MTLTQLAVDQSLAAERFADWLTGTPYALTPTQRTITELLASHFGAWVPNAAVVRALYRRRGYHADLLNHDLDTLRTHIWRLRQKLAPVARPRAAPAAAQRAVPICRATAYASTHATAAITAEKRLAR